MITEEALPNYTLPLSRIARDDTGTADAPWAKSSDFAGGRPRRPVTATCSTPTCGSQGRITHTNVGKLAAAQGDEKRSKICRRIAGDEACHKTFYTRVVGEIMERDPEGGTLAYRAVLKGVIAMPRRRMDDDKDPDLYDHFPTVTQSVGLHGPRLRPNYRAPEPELGHHASLTHRVDGPGPGPSLSATGTL